MEEEMMMKIMGFSSFGNPKLIGQDDQVVEESPPRRHPEPGIEDRRRRRRRSRERDDGRSRSMDRKKRKRSRSRDISTMGSVGATCNTSNDLLGSILSKMDNTFSKSSQKNKPKAKPQNTTSTTKYISENYKIKHSDPLGLEIEFPTEYIKMVGKLIREDDDPIQNTTFNFREKF